MQFKDAPKKLGSKLVEELTQERYLKNDSVTKQTVVRIDEYLDYYVRLQNTLHSGSHHISRDVTVRWTVQAASVAVEKLLTPNPKTEAFINFAFKHCLEAIDRADFPGVANKDEVAMYCAAHRALIKSDIATTRGYFFSAIRCDRIYRSVHRSEQAYRHMV